MQTVAAKDIYLDENGKLTSDPDKAAQQIAFKGAVILNHARHLYGLNEDGSSAKAEAAEEKKAAVLTSDSSKRESKSAKK